MSGSDDLDALLDEARRAVAAAGSAQALVEVRARFLGRKGSLSELLRGIGELPPAMQPKLLRVLESRAIKRLGESEHRDIDVRLVAATHPKGSEGATDMVRSYVAHGASPRAAIALAESSRAIALLSARPTVGFEDVLAVAGAVLNHRLILNYKARLDQVDTFAVVNDLVGRTDATGLELPADVAITENTDG